MGIGLDKPIPESNSIDTGNWLNNNIQELIFIPITQEVPVQLKYNPASQHKMNMTEHISYSFCVCIDNQISSQRQHKQNATLKIGTKQHTIIKIMEKILFLNPISY